MMKSGIWGYIYQIHLSKNQENKVTFKVECKFTKFHQIHVKEVPSSNFQVQRVSFQIRIKLIKQ